MWLATSMISLSVLSIRLWPSPLRAASLAPDRADATPGRHRRMPMIGAIYKPAACREGAASAVVGMFFGSAAGLPDRFRLVRPVRFAEFSVHVASDRSIGLTALCGAWKASAWITVAALTIHRHPPFMDKPTRIESLPSRQGERCV